MDSIYNGETTVSIGSQGQTHSAYSVIEYYIFEFNLVIVLDES